MLCCVFLCIGYKLPRHFLDVVVTMVRIQCTHVIDYGDYCVPMAISQKKLNQMICSTHLQSMVFLEN